MDLTKIFLAEVGVTPLLGYRGRILKMLTIAIEVLEGKRLPFPQASASLEGRRFVVDVRGALTSHDSILSRIGLGTSAAELGAWLEQASMDRGVKDVVLHIENSPAGQAAPAVWLVDSIRRLREKKPVTTVYRGIVAGPLWLVGAQSSAIDTTDLRYPSGPGRLFAVGDERLERFHDLQGWVQREIRNLGLSHGYMH